MVAEQQRSHEGDPADFRQPPTEAEIERNKDKLDLAPGVEFVSQHENLYEIGLENILTRVPSTKSQRWAENLEFVADDEIVEPQVHPKEARDILARMPETLIRLSKLKDISYIPFGHVREVPIPLFDQDGNFARNAEWVSVNDFPRPQDHPSRILVGISNGETIFPTPIPETVSRDERARYLYQVHVLLHEFFHTIDYPLRGDGKRDAVVLEGNGEKFTFGDWWKEFEELVLSGKEPTAVSDYAATYSHQLNQKTRDQDYKTFTHALAEQICESFVAHQLNIISNQDNWANFREESFGNLSQQELFDKSQAPSANQKWQLIEKLCQASVVEAGE